MDYLEHVSDDIKKLETMCAIGSDICIAFAIGFVLVAILTW